MGLFDYLRCDFPLSNPLDNALEFQTKSLGCGLDQYLIDRDGVLHRLCEDGVWESVDVDRDVIFYSGGARYRACYVDGVLQWIRKARDYVDCDDID